MKVNVTQVMVYDDVSVGGNSGASRVANEVNGFLSGIDPKRIIGIEWFTSMSGAGAYNGTGGSISIKTFVVAVVTFKSRIEVEAD